MSTTTSNINLGTSPNDGTGDPIRDGGQIINDNTLKLFNLSNKIDEGKIGVYKYPGNTDISTVQQNDPVSGIVEDGGQKYFIFAKYNTGSLTNYGTEANKFQDGSYITYFYYDFLNNKLINNFSDIEFNQYPNTRDDGTPINVLHTDSNGNLKSSPTSSIVTLQDLQSVLSEGNTAGLGMSLVGTGKGFELLIRDTSGNTKSQLQSGVLLLTGAGFDTNEVKDQGFLFNDDASGFSLDLIRQEPLIGTTTVQLPNKTAGTYTIATLSDIPAVNTPNIQQVTDEGNTTTNSIEINNDKEYFRVIHDNFPTRDSKLRFSDLTFEDSDVAATHQLTVYGKDSLLYRGDNALKVVELKPDSGLNASPLSGQTVLELPYKGGGSFTVATIEDIPVTSSYYDEGTFTPTLIDTGTGATYTYTAFGDYVRNGNSVTVNIRISVTSTTGTPSGSLEIQGMPFTGKGASTKHALSLLKLSGTTLTDTELSKLNSFIEGTDVNLLDIEGAILSAQDITSGDIWIGGTYITNFYTT